MVSFQAVRWERTGLFQTQGWAHRVIACYSQNAAQDYDGFGKELLTIVKVIDHFYHFGYRRSFTIRANHGALQCPCLPKR